MIVLQDFGPKVGDSDPKVGDFGPKILGSNGPIRTNYGPACSQLIHSLEGDGVELLRYRNWSPSRSKLKKCSFPISI